MNKKVIHSDDAPGAIGSYSQAIQSGNFVFLSGQIPLDPATMEIVAGDFEARARRVFENLKAVAEAAGGTLDQIVKLFRAHMGGRQRRDGDDDRVPKSRMGRWETSAQRDQDRQP